MGEFSTLTIRANNLVKKKAELKRKSSKLGYAKESSILTCPLISALSAEMLMMTNGPCVVANVCPDGVLISSMEDST